MGRAQGELRGPNARTGGGDWDAHADDFADWVEPEPGEQCKAYLYGETSILVTQEPAITTLSPAAVRCQRPAPVGSSLCTPCHRRRIRTSAIRRSLEHRQRIAEQTGRPLEEIQ